jgi:hypothetical protein
MPDEPARGIAVGPGEGELIRNPLGGDITHLVRGEQSNGALAALEAVNSPGEGPPLHVHTREPAARRIRPALINPGPAGASPARGGAFAGRP